MTHEERKEYNRQYYKKFYQKHKEEEKKRVGAYYKEHRDEILAKKKAKRDAEPKKVKLIANDYKKMWVELENRTICIPFFRNLLFEIQVERLNQKKEMLKND